MGQTAEAIRNSASHIKGIHHIGISVSDVDAQLAFIQQATTMSDFEHQSFSGPNAPVAATKSAIVRGPNSYLEFMQFETQAADTVPVEGPGFTHICFQSPADLNFYNKFTDASAKAVSWGDGPVDLGGYGVHYAYLRDQDQTMYEIEQLDRPQFTGDVWIAHVALVSPDIDALMAFYSTLFDIEPYRRVNKVTGPRADEVTGLKDVRSRAGWFNVGNMIFEIWEYINPVTPNQRVDKPFSAAGYNKFAFEVSDLEAEVARLNNIGGSIISEVVATAIGKEVYATDPDGNRFSFVELHDLSKSIDHLQGITWKTA